MFKVVTNRTFKVTQAMNVVEAVEATLDEKGEIVTPAVVASEGNLVSMIFKKKSFKDSQTFINGNKDGLEPNSLITRKFYEEFVGVEGVMDENDSEITSLDDETVKDSLWDALWPVFSMKIVTAYRGIDTKN